MKEHTNNKLQNKIIWALYDDGYGSWNRLNKDNIISVGINDNNWKNYKRIDISLNNPNLIKDFLKLPKPYAIVASPPCESWSIADNSRRAYRYSDVNKMVLFDEMDYAILNQRSKLKRNFFKQHQKRLIGESTILAVCYLIKFFNPKIWVIENPKTSKIWNYISNWTRLSGKKNNTYYSNYDSLNFTQKPTTFLSNIDLSLLNDSKIKSSNKWAYFNNNRGYNISSSIPSKLIKDIFNKIETF